MKQTLTCPKCRHLRVGDYRVFYDVSTEETVVYVRAVRKKPPGKKQKTAHDFF